MLIPVIGSQTAGRQIWVDCYLLEWRRLEYPTISVAGASDSMSFVNKHHPMANEASLYYKVVCRCVEIKRW